MEQSEIIDFEIQKSAFGHIFVEIRKRGLQYNFQRKYFLD